MKISLNLHFSSEKIAIIHDSFFHIGGAEQVLLTLVKMFPKADIYIPLLSRGGYREIKKHKAKGKINRSLLSYLPLPEKYSSFLKPFVFLYWKCIDLSRYDLVISSSHSFSSKSVITGPQTLHISYIHTPPRYLYDEYNEMQFMNKGIIKILIAPLMTYLRKLDYIDAQRPDILVANSKNVQKRIEKYYKRKSIVIYPPVKLPKSENKTTSKNYYLFFSSLVKQKGAELAVKTFNSLKKPLVVVGTGPRKTYLKKLAKDNIKFKGFIPERDKGKIYAGAKALVYCSIEEDFGMVPVEAMAHGVPVIAYKSGGVSETIVDGKTGLLFNKHSIEDLQRVIAKFEGMKFSSSACKNQAKQFSEKIFIKSLLNLIRENIDKKK